MRCDCIVVGSGPAGVNAAAPLVESGWNVTMLDVGNEPRRDDPRIPSRPFSEIRHSDFDQHRYFLGDRFEGIPLGKVRIGAQLTPARQYVVADVERLMPTNSESFSALESLALGGLGSAWGANVFPFNDDEFARMSLRRCDFDRHYEAVARRIGVSGSYDDLTPLMGGYPSMMPPLGIDSNAERILASYHRKKRQVNRKGFYLGQTPLAVCTQEHRGRPPHPYHDMDFWALDDRSVYRPRWTLDELKQFPNFQYVNRTFVTSFEDQGAAGVDVHGHHSESLEAKAFHARTLILAAGTLSTARIALRSLGHYQTRIPILCNPYTYIPVINLPMIGRVARDARHSLAQLTAIYRPVDDPIDAVQSQFYSYRSLLMFKLLKENPVSCRAGIHLFRLLMNSLGVLAINHSDTISEAKYCELRRGLAGAADTLRIDYSLSEVVADRLRRREREVCRYFRRLGCWALKTIYPGHGSSIHYAGTLRITDSDQPLTCTHACRLRGTRQVYVADASVFSYLPAKGLTFTIMANANRVGCQVAETLGAERVAAAA